MGCSKRATIREVSQLSGVSVATVSRVIHQNGRFSEETESRVRKAMEELCYEPDILAQGMRKQTMPIVGVLIPDVLDDNMALMMRTVQEELFDQNYSTIFFNSSESSQKSQRFLDIMRSQHAAGVIYVPDRASESMELYGFPVVYFDRAPTDARSENSVLIEQNNYECAKEVIGWMLDKGCKRIAILGDRYNISNHEQRMRGANDALAQHSLQPVSIINADPQKSSEAVDLISRAIDSGMDFDGIFCTSVRLTIGAMSALEKWGRRKDIQVAGYGVHRLYRYGLINYLAVYEPIKEMAIAAATSLICLIHGDDVQRQQVFHSHCLYGNDEAQMFLE